MFWLPAMSFKIDSMSNQIPCMITEIMNKSWNNHLPYYIQKIFSVKILGTFFILIFLEGKKVGFLLNWKWKNL